MKQGCTRSSHDAFQGIAHGKALEGALALSPAAALPPCLRQGIEGAAEVSPCCLSRYRKEAWPISTVFFLSANGTKFFEFVEKLLRECAK